jgi:hypothetical protein
MQVGDVTFDLARQQQDAAKLFVRFSIEAKRNERKSVEEGRPVFDDVEYIEILTPGDKGNSIHRPIREHDKQRFGAQYEAWKKGLTEPVSGTPLSEWPGVTRSQVEMLAFHNCRTVEHLAGLSLSNAQSIGPVQSLVQRARDYLEKAKGDAPLLKVRAELAERDNRIEALEKQIQALIVSNDNRERAHNDNTLPVAKKGSAK